MKCDYCNKHDAVRYEYRDFNGCVGKYRVCNSCFNLNNETIREIIRKEVDIYGVKKRK
jgi:hypothetical protein